MELNNSMENQEKVWDRIAPEWDEFKSIPAKHTVEFLSKTSGKVLDLGSGSGRHLFPIKNGKMYLVDFSKEMLKLAEKKGIPAKFKHSNLWKTGFEDEFFDYAICISALHCIESKKNREKTVKELYRILKKGAKAEIGVWNIESKRFKSVKGKDKIVKWTDKGERYYYLYDEEEIHNLFKKNGFKILSIHNSEMMINFIVEK